MKHLIQATVLACFLTAFFSSEPHAETRQVTGGWGLNTVPDARFDDKGRVSLTLSHLAPYTHFGVGAQLTDRFYVAIRQSAEGNDPLEEPRRLYPGLDTKIKIVEEGPYRPQIAVGAQSAFGHKQMAGEYLALSKRYYRFDFTAGMGWGRFGQAGHIDNPLSVIPHFDQQRPVTGEDSNGPGDWFTGERVGFFGGLSYKLPVDNLRLTADYNADRYRAEIAEIGFDAPAPWSVGLQYQPDKWLNAGLGLVGGDKVMARLTVQPFVPQWPLRPAKREPMRVVRPYRPQRSTPEQITLDAAAEGYWLYPARDIQQGRLLTTISLEPHDSAPLQIGRAARHVMNNTRAETGILTFQPRMAGLQGPQVTLVRRDLEQAYVYQRGSAEEIWRGAEFGQTLTHNGARPLNESSLWPDHLVLDQQIGLSEEDQGVLYRTSLLVEEQRELLGSLLTGGAVRFDLGNNLEQLNEFRPRSFFPVRSDVDLFAQRTVSLDRLYLSWVKTLKPELHLGITGGYLEEMYAGLGGEVLYRPFGKNWAVGADIWQVARRDPLTPLNQGLTVDSLLTGHVQGWYRFPEAPGTSLQVRAGRYLAEDLGTTMKLKHRFDNGASLSGFITASETSDYDIFGEEAHLHHGLRLSLPLGSVKHIPRGSRMDFSAEPFGRDRGQALDKPVELYDLTEAFSLQHMAKKWGEINR